MIYLTFLSVSPSLSINLPKISSSSFFSGIPMSTVMRRRSKNTQELLWPRLHKLLHLKDKEHNYSADTEDEDDSDAESDTEDSCPRGSRSRFAVDEEQEEDEEGDDYEADNYPNNSYPRRRRRNSETFRGQYISTKEIRIRVGTWNAGGKIPPEDLDIDDWININDPADIYVLGLQEIVPLNAGNIFGPEDSRPAAKWENIIRGTLSRVQAKKCNIKCHSDPPSPSKFRPHDDVPYIEEELSLASDSDVGEEIHPLDEEEPPCSGEFKDVCADTGISDSTVAKNDFKRQFSSKKRLDRLFCLQEEDGDVGKEIHPLDKEEPGSGEFKDVCANTGISDSAVAKKDFKRQFSSKKRLDRLYCLKDEDGEETVKEPAIQNIGKLNRVLSLSERVGLSWPEPPLTLLNKRALDRQTSLQSLKAFAESKSFKSFSSFKSTTNQVHPEIPDLISFAELDLDTLMRRKRGVSYVRIVSKQMVGIFITIWVRKSLRKHIQNLKVSTVGVGVMGYIGNKGSVSVSMSIYQTLFCFVCTHLTSGEKEGDELKRNSDVHEIHRRTHFHPFSAAGLPKSIHDHEKIIWLGDLNYRINLSYEKTREFISRHQWSELAEKDQLVKELRKGRPFDGWSEGTIAFPPTYKYENNSDRYCGEDPKNGRRTPAWCDRILSYGKGMKLLSYQRCELKHSDHRPVTATYMAEVEVYSSRKLQRALTLTDAEIKIIGGM